MYISIANRSLACSSLMMGGFGGGTLGASQLGTIEAFAKRFFRSWGDAYDECDNEGDDALQGYAVPAFAFIAASTDQSQTEVESVLRQIGMIETKRVSKKKNPDTECIFWVMPVADFIAKLAPLAPKEYAEALKLRPESGIVSAW